MASSVALSMGWRLLKYRIMVLKYRALFSCSLLPFRAGALLADANCWRRIVLALAFLLCGAVDAAAAAARVWKGSEAYGGSWSWSSKWRRFSRREKTPQK